MSGANPNPLCRVVPGLASGTAQGTLPWSWYSDLELYEALA